MPRNSASPSTRKIEPLFSYYGSKSKIVRKYPRPQHRTIIEPFAGAAHYACYHTMQGNADRVILIERNPLIAGIWQWLTGVSEDEFIALPYFRSGDLVTYPRCRYIQHFLRLENNFGSVGVRFAGKYGRSHGDTELRQRRAKLASQLKYIRHFEIIQGGYHLAPDIEATWFIDPPYQYAGGHAYKFGSDRIPYDDLARKVRAWRGLKIVCEAENENGRADWLPFRTLGHFQGQRGKTKELIYIHRRRTPANITAKLSA